VIRYYVKRSCSYSFTVHDTFMKLSEHCRAFIGGISTCWRCNDQLIPKSSRRWT